MKRVAFLVTALLLAYTLPAARATHDRGVVYLDDYTFDKVVDGGATTFVRFDKEYAWGDDHDQFKNFGKRVGEIGHELVVAALPLSKREYEQNQNNAVADRYGIQEQDWPVFLLFKKGVSSKGTPIRYSGGKKEEDFLRFVAQETGAFFGLKGQIKEFEDLIKDFIASEDKKALVEKAAKLPLDLPANQQEHADYYIKTFQRISEKGLGYVAAETARLRKMTDDKNISKDKKEKFQPKLNILASFAAAIPTPAKEEL